MSIETIAVLEIGTSRIRVVVGELRDDGFVTVVGKGECESRGIRKGEIIDRDDAITAVRAALKEAEANWRKSIKQIHLITSGGQAGCKISQGLLKLVNAAENQKVEIVSEDVDDVVEIARKVALPENRIKLHSFRQHFEIDDSTGKNNPVGLTGEELRLDMLTIHGKRSTVDNFRKLVEDIPIECVDAVFSGVSCAMGVLTAEQKDAGVLLIDIGGGTTDYVLYHDGIMRLAGSVAVGGNHITNDISIGFSIPQREAEYVKIRDGSAMINLMERDHNISIPAKHGFSGKMVRAVTLNTIINARMDEILTLIKNQIEEQCPAVPLSSGVLLTGGGSFLSGARDLCQKIFNVPCAQGKPFDVKGLDSSTDAAFYSAAVGCIRYTAVLRKKEKAPSAGRRFLRWMWGGGHA